MGRLSGLPETRPREAGLIQCAPAGGAGTTDVCCVVHDSCGPPGLPSSQAHWAGFLHGSTCVGAEQAEVVGMRQKQGSPELSFLMNGEDHLEERETFRASPPE